jgi:hypothetical protein
MTDAFKCEECGEFSTKYPGGSLSLEVSPDVRSETYLNRQDYTKQDLCAECVVKFYEELFGNED